MPIDALFVLLCCAVNFETRPVLAAKLGSSSVNSTAVNFDSLREAEQGLVDKLFIYVKGLLAESEKGASGDSNGWRQMGASDDRGELGSINPAYHRMGTKNKGAIEPQFATQCAFLVEEMVKKRLRFLGDAHSQELIGMDIATHFQVQCPGAIPMTEEKCDKHASDLARLVDSGKIVPWADKGKPSDISAFLQVHSEGEDSKKWCKAFFVDFWDSVVLQVKNATPQRAPIGPGGKGQLSPYGPSTVNQYGPTDEWTPR